jgi:3-deoxy-7-phosphoheptulonate synthase
MIAVMQEGATSEQIQRVVSYASEHGVRAHVSEGDMLTIVSLIGDTTRLDREQVAAIDGVERAERISAPYKLAARSAHPGRRTVRVHKTEFGGQGVPIIAGPCSVESREQFMDAAAHLSSLGIGLVRGGAFKPRTSPYSFQGLGEEGLAIMAEARERYDVGIVTEVMSENEVELVSSYADMLQIGTRNMANFRLLAAVGRQDKPVLLKRGIASTIEEWLLAAEYIMSEGNHNVVLCERGIKSFEPQLRGACDIGSLILARELSCLPVILDPSHATGKASLVTGAALAGIAADADGIIVEAHADPSRALSDAEQSITFAQAEQLLHSAVLVAAAVGRKIPDSRTGGVHTYPGL